MAGYTMLLLLKKPDFTGLGKTTPNRGNTLATVKHEDPEEQPLKETKLPLLLRKTGAEGRYRGGTYVLGGDPAAGEGLKGR